MGGNAPPSPPCHCTKRHVASHVSTTPFVFAKCCTEKDSVTKCKAYNSICKLKMIVIYTKILLFHCFDPSAVLLFSFQEMLESWACMHGVNTKQLLPLSNKSSKWFPALCRGRIYHARHACAETELLHRRIEDAIALGIFGSG